jgi:peptide/nickel transport system substrate-binding protein
VKLIDKYTLEIHYHERFSADLFYFLGYEDRSVISAPEMAAVPGRAAKWENQVTTGPYRFDEYLIGSYFAVSKNPDFWKKWTYEGKEYQLPFIDRIVLPIVPDPATRLAAIKTGTAELHLDLPAEYWSTIDRSTPELKKRSLTVGFTILALLRSDIPPFDDPKVRRAMMIGTDISKHQQVWAAAGMPIHAYPIYPAHPSYTPLEKLPADIRELYDYNPEKAKKMLAEAGYPDGLKIDLHTDSEWPKAMDTASLLQDQWSKIGVDATIVPAEKIEHTRKRYSHPPIYTGACFSDLLEASMERMFTMFYKSEVDLNWMAYSNSELDRLCELIEKELDPDKMVKHIKEAGDIWMRDIPAIPLSIVPQRIYWWPWLKNYYGTVAVGYYNVYGSAKYRWIDHDLKAELEP